MLTAPDLVWFRSRVRRVDRSDVRSLRPDYATARPGRRRGAESKFSVHTEPRHTGSPGCREPDIQADQSRRAPCLRVCQTPSVRSVLWFGGCRTREVCENVIDREANLRRPRGDGLVTAMPHLPVRVAIRAGIGIHGDGDGLHVHQPRLGNAGPAVSRHLLQPAVAQGRVGYFGDEEDIAGLGMTIGVEARAAPRHHEIRLRFRVVVQSNRILDTYVRLAGQACDDQFVQTAHEPCMKCTDRRHCDDLSIEQLHPIFRGEDPRFAHPRELVDGEAVPPHVRDAFRFRGYGHGAPLPCAAHVMLDHSRSTRGTITQVAPAPRSPAPSTAGSASR